MRFDDRTSTGLEKPTLGGQKRNLVCPRTQKKGAVTLEETEPDLPASVQESLEVLWVDRGCLGVRGTEHNSPGISPFEEVTITAITPTIVWPQAKLQGGNTVPESTENWIKDLLSMAPLIRAKADSSKASTSMRKLTQASYPYPSEGRQNGTHNYRKLTRLIACITTGLTQ